MCIAITFCDHHPKGLLSKIADMLVFTDHLPGRAVGPMPRVGPGL